MAEGRDKRGTGELLGHVFRKGRTESRETVRSTHFSYLRPLKGRKVLGKHHWTKTGLFLGVENSIKERADSGGKKRADLHHVDIERPGGSEGIQGVAIEGKYLS